MLSEYPDEVEADLASEYRIDLSDLWRGGLTLRRAGVLTHQLPSGARLWQATGGPKAWSDEFHALMVVEWRLQILEWRKTEDGAKGKNPPQMQEHPTFMGDEQKKAHTADAKAREFMRRQQAIEARRITQEGTG